MAQMSHRGQLLDGAITCLKTKGYARTTARDIATASGANLASIGYHFGSKEALLNEALSRIFDERQQHLGQVTLADADAGPLERMSTVFEAVLAMFEKNRPLLIAFLEAMAQAGRSEDLREQMAVQYRQTRRDVAALVEASLGRGSDDAPGTSEAFASFLIATLDGLVIQWLVDQENTPSGAELVASLRDTMTIALR